VVRSDETGAAARWGIVLGCALAISCGGGGGGGGGDGGTAEEGGTGDDDGVDDEGMGEAGVDTGGAGSADESGGDDGTTTDGADCAPVGFWSDPAPGPIPVSKDLAGMPVPGSAPSLSADGRFAAYCSLVNPTGEAPSGNLFAIFVHDAVCDTTTWVPFQPPAEPITEAIDPVISDDGSTVVFATRDSEQEGHMYVADLLSGTIEPIDVDVDGNVVGTGMWHYELSADGRVVTFHTDRALVPEDFYDTDVYVLDRDTGEIELVCPEERGVLSWCSSPSISADGRWVAYERPPLVLVYDRMTGAKEEVSHSPPPSNNTAMSGAPSISADGRFVAFHSDKNDLVPDDTNATTDVFVRDRETDELVRILAPDGAELDGPAAVPEISGDGNVVVFVMGWYGAGDPSAQIYAWDRRTGTTRRISETASGEVASFPSAQGKVSADGRWAVFETNAPNLLPEGMPSSGWYAYAVSLE
jgi:Tol biopolymer transport system component